jgi:hypothetical protein
MRYCGGCKRVLDPSSFHKGATQCKDCAKARSRKDYARRMKDPDYVEKKRKADRDRWRARKEEAVALMGGKCNDCGGTFPAPVYDFHHLDPSEKDMNPSDALTSVKHWKDEIKKCVLLCANCHRMRHWNED